MYACVRIKGMDVISKMWWWWYALDMHHGWKRPFRNARFVVIFFLIRKNKRTNKIKFPLPFESARLN